VNKYELKVLEELNEVIQEVAPETDSQELLENIASTLSHLILERIKNEADQDVAMNLVGRVGNSEGVYEFK